MSALVKQDITFRFGPTDQDTGDKHLRPGTIKRLENARQLKRYDYRPRRGFSRTAFVADTGSFAGPPDSYVYTDAHLVRDAAGVNWAYDTALGKFRNLGAIERPFPTTTSVLGPDTLAQPVLVVTGGYDWTFSLQTRNGAFGSGFTYTVRDNSTDRIAVVPTTLTVSSICSLTAVSDGTNVFLFVVNQSASIVLYTFDATTLSLTSSSTYQTVGSAQFQQVDAHLLASGEVFVAAASWVSTVSYAYTHSYLNKATGVAKASPVPVTTSGVPSATVDGFGIGVDQCSGVSILVSDGTNGKAYYALWRPGGGASISLALVEVNTTTLAINSTTTLVNKPSTAAILSVSTSGALQANGDRVVVAHSSADDSAGGIGTAPIKEAAIHLTTYTRTAGGSTTTAPMGRSCWVSSKPFLVGSSWYLITGTSQTDYTASATLAQDNRAAYHLRSLSATNGHVIAQVAYGLGARGGSNGYVYGAYPVTVSGTDVFFAIIYDGGVSRLKLDFAVSTYGQAVVLGNKALVPGPIPYYFSSAETPRELSPLYAPVAAVGSVASGTARYVQVVHRFVDASGVIDRSSPGPVQGFASLPPLLSIFTLKHFLGTTPSQIEVYITDPSSETPVLRYARSNDPTVDYITIDTTLGYDNVSGEAIYTQGGALAASPPPPCRNAAVWKNRVVLSGTPRIGQVLPSLEISDAANGPRFNLTLASYWPDTQTDILRIEPISWSDCAVMSSTAIGYISGTGPNGKGFGPYTIQTLSTGRKGVANARGVRGAPAGVFFQATDDRFFLLGPGGVLEDVSTGAVDYTSPVSASLHNHEEHQVLLWLEDGKELCLDYQRPTEEQTRGQWAMWSSTGLTRAYGAAMVNGEPVHMEADGARRGYQVAFTDTIAAGGEAGYDLIIESGELAVFDLGHCFRLASALVHGEYVAATTLRCDWTFDNGMTTPPTYAEQRVIAAAPFQTRFKPAKGGRIQSVKFLLTISCFGGGGVFSGMTLTVQDRGTKFPNAGQRATKVP